MRVIPVPCLRDNFAYLLICPQTEEVAVVDPSEPDPVLSALDNLGLKLSAIFNTHHHYDHVGGNKALVKKYPGIKVWGHVSDRKRIPKQTEFVEEGDPVGFGKVTGSLTHNPGHTTGAVTFYFGDDAFTGDTLFAAGCGRLFEGTPEDMHRSLNHKIGARAPETRLWFGHEYTETNLRFAQSVEPDNKDVVNKLTKVREMRAAGEWTTPTTLAEEWRTNPFMRVDSEGIQQTVRCHDPSNDLQPASVLGVIRALKDKF